MNNFPTTPVTLIGRLRDPDDPLGWDSNWQRFFDLYHSVIRACVFSGLRKQGWGLICDADVDDIVVNLMEDLYATDKPPIDVKNYSFRQMLRMLVHRRVVDFIRKRQKHRNDVGGFAVDELDALPSNEPEKAEEKEAFQQAALVRLLDVLRTKVRPQVFLIFELVKLKGVAPAQVAVELGVERGVVDNSVFKAMQKLRELAQNPDLQKEFNHE